MSTELHPDAQILAEHSLGLTSDHELAGLIDEHLEMCSSCREDWRAIGGVEQSRGRGKILRFPGGDALRRPLIAAAAAGVLAAVGLGMYFGSPDPAQAPATLVAETEVPFVSSGFENGLSGWTSQEID